MKISISFRTIYLIRGFFAKKTDFANISEKQIKHVQHLLNDRPRKSVGFLTQMKL
jgi:IS30 family transposase